MMPQNLFRNMLLQYFEFVLGFTILFLVFDVHSQIVFPGSSCDRNSYCVPAQRCPTLRSNPNAGVTCGSQRRLRRVCCPRTIETPPVITPAPNTPAPVPNPPTPAPNPPVSGPRPTPRRTRGCGQSSAVNFRTPLVLGGENATEGAWPWMVALTMWERRPRAFTAYCTGFLIDNIHVLTAAHCFENKRLDLYQARIGSVDQTRAEIYPIARIVSHEGYRPNMYYDDIAVLTLERPVTDPDFNPICLPDEDIMNMNLDTRGTTVAGWGRTQADPNSELSLLLQQLSAIPVVPNQECNRKIRENTGRRAFQTQFPRGITRGFLCAGIPEGGKDSCGGDSGGPLMFEHNDRWYAVGIVSFGISCGRPGIPAGYTRITEYMDWIAENTRD